MEKNQTNATSVTKDPLINASAMRKQLKAHNGEKSNKCKQCYYASSIGKQIEETFESTQWNKGSEIKTANKFTTAFAHFPCLAGKSPVGLGEIFDFKIKTRPLGFGQKI